MDSPRRGSLCPNSEPLTGATVTGGGRPESDIDTPVNIGNRPYRDNGEGVAATPLPYPLESYADGIPFGRRSMVGRRIHLRKSFTKSAGLLPLPLRGGEGWGGAGVRGRSTSTPSRPRRCGSFRASRRAGRFHGEPRPPNLVAHGDPERQEGRLRLRLRLRLRPAGGALLLILILLVI